MVEARHRALARGHYDAVSSAVNTLALRAAPRVVVDAGCGEGSYLHRLMLEHATPGDACFIGIDISRDALRLAARSARDALFLVGDIGHRLCVADASADVLLNIFAPRNEQEFARVLRPGGTLVVVVPAEDHLRELRERHHMLGVQDDKLERTLARLSRFVPESHEELRYATSLTADDVRDVIRMGPSYWHVPADFTGIAAEVTVAVHVIAMRRE